MPTTSKPAPAEQTPAPVLSNKQRRKLSKREQAAYSLEMVEVRRREARRKQIRRRVTVVISSVLAVAVVGTGAGLLIWKDIRDSYIGPANMLSDGLLLTGSTDSSTNKATISPVTTDAIQTDAKPVATNLANHKSTANVALYLDYADPKSATFMAANGATLENWLGAGYITLEMHPIATTSSAKNDYSRRAANALACVAANDPSQFLTVSDALIKAASTKKQTSKSTTALTALVTKAGVTDTKVTDCIGGTSYGNWVDAATHRATHGGLLNADKKSLTAAPLVEINKKSYTGKLDDSSALTSFIASLYSSSSSSSSTGG
ncbi:thioredoxin domain-containing protein [Lysinimonas soli]|uniref:Thioredoxin domain-containing protein n=1 Tax=Lysinimonas soli TaxID=1074233 RepID=A0ABW0NPF5_9MICO